jgi:hypothetical protein
VIDEKMIDLYLMNEMSEDERQHFEEKFATEDGLFYEIVERENELVDRYASGDLSGDARARFERSLESNPARRQKVTNSRMLREFIGGERENRTITIAEREGFFSRLKEFFALRPMQFATAALLIAFALWSTYLLIENRRLRVLDEELAAARGRDAELASQINNEREATGDLTADLDAERVRIQKLEEEIARLKQTSGPSNNTAPPEISRPTIATLVLMPGGIRGGSGMPVMKLAPTIMRASIVIDVPQETGERVGIRLNGEPVAEKRAVLTRGGEKTVSITLPVTKLKDGKNTIEVLDSNGSKLSEYSFAVTRGQ